MSSEYSNQREIIRAVELVLFKERIGKFTEADLELDGNGACKEFEHKIRLVFPELVDEDRLRAMKAAITMHFLEKYS